MSCLFYLDIYHPHNQDLIVSSQIFSTIVHYRNHEERKKKEMFVDDEILILFFYCYLVILKTKTTKIKIGFYQVIT
jgi:hypothetical protein